ncbi:hypothetical protein [Ketogulonicigenium vulgare]|uniref:Uncharacterized protein n=1 Tax=Ketogulonicigenium vulgare (strain WSH-001) TaxID=759362 RepID=F9Y3E1_KETVW|nr:hypothetical protein [Ketogulonicigenium vulgare]ADO42178.1 hypothetical protein EIO_1031 [Ketogulonicigenium vulgare Y25]AEM40382.1 hypothetical protein KVU_0543 [Ketogulonicigenium vulgare WSH-001]ALJ80569.1 hypothetical protein KVH_04900 [Ketogulonicigenium vulgare]ANW33389.1 hypothetical protein KvSKV_04870 [Ketogulonicigenium vulgare]AOZ54095.1 hypothetical protein KVC_1078 [Ketogulonicigenium vulgare]
MSNASDDKILQQVFDDVAAKPIELPEGFLAAVQQGALAAMPAGPANDIAPPRPAAPRHMMQKFSALGALCAAAVCGLWIGAVLPQVIGVGQASAAITVPLYQDLDVYALLEE